MGTALKVVGWFFGILIFLIGLIIFANVLFRLEYLAGPLLAGLLVMLIGALICYGGGRAGKKKDPTYYKTNTSSPTQNINKIEKEKKEKMKRLIRGAQADTANRARKLTGFRK